MSHDHHHHHHGHDHAPKDFGRAFAIGVTLNSGFVLIEAIYGYLSNSMALIADAGHNLSDVLGLLAAWGASSLALRPPTKRFTYGMKSSSILSALFNALLLLVACGAIGWEAILRLLHPQAVASWTIMVVAAIGIAVNTATALLFASGRKGDLNIRSAYLHMAADAAVSAGVVLAALAITVTGWQRLDPAASLAIIAVILWGTWGLLRESVAMSLDAVPSSTDLDKVHAFLDGSPGVQSVHDLHIWHMSTTEIALTAHLVMPGGHPGDKALMAMCEELEHHHGIGHATLQVELDPKSNCALRGHAMV
jgi:cobalt-zinc-cadmium efflux system protein